MKAKFLKAIDNNDIVSVRLFLSNELMLDPRGRSFNEMREYAEKHIAQLYEQESRSPHTEDEAMWNESFLFHIKNELDYKFTKELLLFYERVAKFVLKEKAAQLDAAEKAKDTQSQVLSETTGVDNDENRISNKALYKGILCGGAVITLAGVCISKVAIMSLGIAGVVLGGYLLYNDSKK